MTFYESNNVDWCNKKLDIECNLVSVVLNKLLILDLAVFIVVFLVCF